MDGGEAHSANKHDAQDTEGEYLEQTVEHHVEDDVVQVLRRHGLELVVIFPMSNVVRDHSDGACDSTNLFVKVSKVTQK